MLIIPAIDIKDGKVVRLVQGKPSDKKVYSLDPVKTAKHWIRQGAKLIHVVDLDGAITGKPKNLGVVKEIVNNSTVPIQLGGGIRGIEEIEKILAFGVYRIVLGTKAIADEVFLKKAFKKFKDKIIISIDAKGRSVKVGGWLSSQGNKDMFALARTLKETGFKQMIYTDILKDGTLKGPNIKNIKKLLKETGLKIIASGGVSSLSDIYKLKMLEKQGVIGVIIGKALYEGKFTLPQALKQS